MATYYQESSAEFQADGLQTLYLMNPNNYVGFSDSQHRSSPTNVFFFNENSSAATSGASAVSHVLLPQTEQFVGIPISHEYPGHSSALDEEEEIHGSCHNTIVFPSFGHYSSWGTASVDQSEPGNQPNMYQQTSKVLSLSLSPHQERFVDNKSVRGYQDFSGQSSNGTMISPKNSTSQSSIISAVPNGINTVQSVIIGSKYLKAAKLLLDEVVSIGKGIENGEPKGSKDYKVKKSKESTALNVKASSTGGENGGKGGGVELKIPQRQELHMKKAKLLCMLDEVEQRYRQYHHQMQIVVESFEQVAGIGSAKSYTNLALNTILKQFKCLKDAVSGQIKELNKTLGEEQGLKDGARVLKSVDHQLRQEKTVQHLGMMQNNAWRPHRGLPETAVSVLRAWLFENFLHPYPKDSDKQMLAKKTGLTRSQVSNWFINARVRLWKPMVEEMYLEEIKNQEEHQEQANSDENCRIKNEPAEKELEGTDTDKTDRVSSFQSKPQNLQVRSPTEISASTVITTSPPTTQPGFAQLITSLNMENTPENNPKKPRNQLDHTQNISPNSMLSSDMETKETRKGFMNNKFSSDEQDYFSGTRFGYEIGELGLRFNNNTGQLTTGQIFHRNNNNNNNNNAFLTLALPPSQNSPLSAARNHHQNFHSNSNFEFGTRTESGSISHTTRVNGLQDSNIGYEQILDFQNRKTFPSQLLPDFLA